jgi:hypothetical protein
MKWLLVQVENELQKRECKEEYEYKSYRYYGPDTLVIAITDPPTKL